LVAPDETGIYAGKIILNSQNLEKEILTTLNVQSKNTLFDMIVTIPEKEILNGRTLMAQFNLLPVGEKGVDVTIKYLIKDFQGRVFFENSETFYVDSEKSFIKEFDTDNLVTGDYVLGAEMTYIGGVAVASTQFEIVESNTFPVTDIKFFIFTGISLLIILIIIGFLIYRKIKIQKNIKKYKRGR